MRPKTEPEPTFYSRHLPHYVPPGATLFMTFRLAGSLPKSIMEALKQEYEQINQQLDEITVCAERKAQAYLEQRKYFGRWDKILDQATYGPTWLQVDEVAKLVKESIQYRDGKVYKLHAYCIMNNHVHVLFTPVLRDKETYHPLQEIMQSLKGYTAYNANQVLGRSGSFWHNESYDHVVRDTEEHQRIVHYILNNPVKAGLVAQADAWPWSFAQ